MIEKFRSSPIIPVLTFNDIDDALKTSEDLIKRDMKNLEITLRTPNALKCIEAVVKEFPEAFVGAGTIVRKEQLVEVKEAGCGFAVSPGFTKSLVEEARRLNLGYLPGVSTPSEIIALSELGVSFMKFFHAGNSGGYKMLKAYADIFSEINFCPTGGISQEDYAEYLKLPNVICVGGSWIVK